MMEEKKEQFMSSQYVTDKDRQIHGRLLNKGVLSIDMKEDIGIKLLEKLLEKKLEG